MRKALRILPVLLLCGLLLSGCSEFLDELLADDTWSYTSDLTLPRDAVPYSEIQYTRPDLQAFDALAQEVISLAAGKDYSALTDALEQFYTAYDAFDTNASLANLHYSADLSDGYWEEENTFCTACYSDLEPILNDVYHALAISPCRKKLQRDWFTREFLDYYAEEDTFDPVLAELNARENELINQYYAQSEEAGSSLLAFFFSDTDDMAQTLVDLILVRRQIAAQAGYDTYEEYANEAYFYRDYTPEQMDAYLESIRVHLAPLHKRCCTVDLTPADTDTEQTFLFVQSTANRLGGTFAEGFRLLETAGLYDIAPGSNKYPASFEIYLSAYQEPFVFMDPSKTAWDHLTFAHEFGHFCTDFAANGSVSGIDVLEIFSQATEYLALCYGPDGSSLTALKLTDSLCTYVEQAMYAAFERAMYQIPESELSIDALNRLYAKTADSFGISSEEGEFTGITHFYTNPMYVSSYIISNDAAMQIYAMELESRGSGRDCLEASLATQEPYFLAFLEDAGLVSPFEKGRVEAAAELFERTLLPAA